MFWAKALIAICATAASGDSELLYFSASWCQPCRSMQPIVARLESTGYRVRHVDVDRAREVAQRYGVQSVPCFIIQRDGQEMERIVGATSYERLLAMFQAADTAPGAVSQAFVRGQSPDRPALAAGSRPAAALVPVPQPGRNLEGRATPGVAPAAIERSMPDLPSRIDSNPDPGTRPQRPLGRSSDPRAAQTTVSSVMAATVRLRVDDSRGRSYGTGTIIDVHQDEALVVTCGHIFRESQGKGQITVDLFHRQAASPVRGTLVSYDLARDVGLVSIRPGAPVTPVQVAGPEDRVHVGDRVFSVGCDRGGDPQTMEGHVNAVNRYTGPPNLVVGGQPVDGRSGGGLFSADGVLIGVCNAADPQQNEGLYAAAATIHQELDRAGLEFIYGRRGGLLAQDAAGPTGNTIAPPERTVAPAVQLVSAPPDERADLRVESMQGRADNQDAHSEVICIVRSKTDPQRASQIIVLDRPSEDFLARLADEIRHRGAGAPRELSQTTDHEQAGAPASGRRIGYVPAEVIRGQTR